MRNLTTEQKEIFQNFNWLWLNDYISTDTWIEMIHFWILGE